MSSENLGSTGDALGDALLPYYRKYMLRVNQTKNLPPDSPSHPDRIMEIGRRNREIRKNSGLTRASLVELMQKRCPGVDEAQIAAFEGGLAAPDDLPPRFADTYSEILIKTIETPDSPGV